MAKIEISVTEASRNFADCVNRARYQDTTFLLVKNGTLVAQLAPGGKPLCTGRDLAKAIAGGHLDFDEASAWQKDLQAARRKLKPPADKWR